jgi:hypothetical protein
MNEDILITVEWNGGIERGFRSKEEAERFISHVCKKTAPDFKYSIYSIIKTSSNRKKG